MYLHTEAGLLVMIFESVQPLREIFEWVDKISLGTWEILAQSTSSFKLLNKVQPFVLVSRLQAKTEHTATYKDGKDK